MPNDDDKVFARDLPAVVATTSLLAGTATGTQRLGVSELDADIRRLQAAQGAAEAKAWPPGATLQNGGYSHTHEAIAEDLKKQISRLREKRERIAAGVDDEPIKEKPAAVAAHKAPRWISSKERREQAAKGTPPESAIPNLPPADEELFAEIEKQYDPANYIAKFETALSGLLKEPGSENRTVSITERHWWAMIMRGAVIETQLRASLHFNRLKRTELEQRIANLETVARDGQRLQKTIVTRRAWRMASLSPMLWKVAVVGRRSTSIAACGTLPTSTARATSLPMTAQPL